MSVYPAQFSSFSPSDTSNTLYSVHLSAIRIDDSVVFILILISHYTKKHKSSASCLQKNIVKISKNRYNFLCLCTHKMILTAR